MQDIAIGRVFRHLRHRLGWTQREAARRCDLSDSRYSDIERGHLDNVSLGRLRSVASIYEVALSIEPRWRGGALDRQLSKRHAAMSEAVARWLVASGWDVRPEVSFNHFGERGVVDLVAWHPASRAILLVEIKTELVDVNQLLGVTDRRMRLAGVIARSCGWEPVAFEQWVVLAESRTNRRRVAEHRTILRARFPRDGRAIAGWLAKPVGSLSALSFLPDSSQAGAGRSAAPVERVRAGALSVARSPQAANFRGLRNLAESEGEEHA